MLCGEKAAICFLSAFLARERPATNKNIALINQKRRYFWPG